MPSAGASRADPSGADASALRAWGAARDAVLRGLVHALSNRVGTIVAAGALLEAGSAETAGRVLGGESERLEALLARFRLATADPFGDGAAPEPVVLADVVGDALALHAYAVEAPAARSAAAGVDGVEGAPPVLASRAGLLHALLVLLAGAGDGVVVRAGVDAGAGAEAGPDVVRLRVEPAPDAGTAAAAAWLLAGSGARAGEGGALVLPRLAR